MRMSPIKKLFTCLVPACLLLLVSSCASSSVDKVEKATVQPIAVTVAEARTGRITVTSTASGQIEPVLSVSVTAKVPGRVTAVYKQMGDLVRTGDLLVTIEDRDASAQLAQAVAQLSQAQAQQEDADRQFTRLSDLLRAGAVSRQQVEQVQTQLSMATAQVAVARASVDLASANLDRTRITAPADGALAVRAVEPGALVGTGTVLFHLVDLSTVVMRAGVAEQDVNHVTPGSGVPVHIPALDTEFTGQVEAVSPNMDRQTRTYQVRVSLPNPEGILKGGMYAQMRFPVRELEGVLLPVAAVVERSGDPVVFVVEGTTAYQRKVRVTLKANDTVAVEGLKTGAAVVTAGQNRLVDGTPVLVGRSTAP